MVRGLGKPTVDPLEPRGNLQVAIPMHSPLIDLGGYPSQPSLRLGGSGYWRARVRGSEMHMPSQTPAMGVIQGVPTS